MRSAQMADEMSYSTTPKKSL